LLTIFNGLALPSPPNKSVKYRTEVVPIEDMLGSFSGNAFQLEQLTGFAGASADVEGLSPIDEDADADELEYVSDFYPSSGPRIGDAADGGYEPFGSFHSEAQMSSSAADLDFQEDHFARQSAVGGTAHRWDSTHNTYSLANEVKLRGSPLRVRIRDVHVIWNLFDGYDWQRTRDTISKAVKDVQAKATERRARASPADEDEESVIGDFLFNSVYIGIPTTRDPRELAHEINRNIDDLASETGSYATSTTVTGLQSHQPGKKREKLRLARSKHHKMTFELKGIAADMVVFPPGSGETQSSLDIRIRDLEIFDHLPTSTWKKFATYMSDAGEREVGMSMVHLEVLNVKPVADLAASELIIKVFLRPI
jgi:autophagy-related protein 2